ncbi:MAG: glycogen/starch synthase [Rubricoccaceae bacterium]|nr:glycogen/starch synthase [Rubricoccaceae bacterium]
MRILYVAGEVAPFSDTTEAARLIRLLPDAVQESEGDFELRIIMPRYGVVSERRNRLHEVIRLSGPQITVGEDTETLKVKVASIPGIRLQVYFMDSVMYFKRKGLHRDRKEGTIYKDNTARALFFARAAKATAKKLGWSPDIVHASGWIEGFVPTVIETEGANDPLFAETRCVYTPDTIDAKIKLTQKDAKAFGLPLELAGKTLQEIGMETASAVAYADDSTEGPEGVDLSGEPEEILERALSLYDSLVEQGVAA